MLVSWGFSFIDRLIPIPPTYAEKSPQVIVGELIQSEVLAGLEIQAEQVEAFLSDPNARVIEGKVIFPRFYQADQGEMFYNAPSSSFFIPRPYPRLIFLLIGPDGSPGVILPIEQSPQVFPHLADAVVIGCQRADYVEALIVVLKGAGGEGDSVYSRADPALTCAE